MMGAMWGQWDAEGGAGDQPDQPADPRYTCVDCGRLVHLDDANVTTRRGRCLCLRCGARPGPPGPPPVTGDGGGAPP